MGSVNPRPAAAIPPSGDLDVLIEILNVVPGGASDVDDGQFAPVDGPLDGGSRDPEIVGGAVNSQQVPCSPKR